MKIEISIIPSRSKNVEDTISVYEFNDKEKPKLITRGNSPQHHAFLQNVTKTLAKEAGIGLCSISYRGNKVFAIYI